MGVGGRWVSRVGEVRTTRESRRVHDGGPDREDRSTFSSDPCTRRTGGPGPSCRPPVSPLFRRRPRLHVRGLRGRSRGVGRDGSDRTPTGTRDQGGRDRVRRTRVSTVVLVVSQEGTCLSVSRSTVVL